MKVDLQRVSAYFDNDLAPDEHAAFRAWLLNDRRHVQEFVVESFVHTQLIELLSPEQARANALVTAEITPTVAKPERPTRAHSRLLAVAVSIASLFVLGYFIMTRPVVVATVTGTRNAQWVTGTERRIVGSLLQAGDVIAIDDGTLHLAFARGGQVAVHGPARFRVESDEAGRLLRGSLSAFVPEHAVGFTIHSGNLKIVDLGTEFLVEQVIEESCELQVFDGLVEVQFDEPLEDEVSNGRIQVSQGQAFRLDSRSGRIKTVDYQKSKRLPISDWSK